MSTQLHVAQEPRRLRGQDEKRMKVYEAIDQHGFNWHVWAVAAYAVFSYSYGISSRKLMLPSLTYIYWRNDEFADRQLKINSVILAGSISSQLLFGYLADRYGRRNFYRCSLIFVAYVTICLAQSSTGAANSMSIMGWAMFWCFFSGVGIGSGLTLSAVIITEFAPVQARARMMAAVFLMQPLGQLTASAMSLLTLMTLGKSWGLATETDWSVSRATVDSMWRIVVGIGALFAIVAFILSLTISESLRYTLDVDAIEFCSDHSENSLDTSVEVERILSSNEITGVKELPTSNEQTIHGLETIPAEPFSYIGIKEYFWTQGNWRYLAGTCACWFLFEIVNSGLGINDPMILSRIWASPQFANSTSQTPYWLDQPSLSVSIYEGLKQDSVHSIMTTSVGALLGSIILIGSIDYVPRKKLLVRSFLSLAVLFAIASSCLFNSFQMDDQALKVMLYVLCQILFNLGPNALTFIISAEIFPTCYRCTCYGISAAFGTFGSLLVQVITSYIGFDNQNAASLRWMLLVFSALMVSGAAFAWAWIPEVQDPRTHGKGQKVPSKTLEVLARGYNGSPKAKKV